MIKKLEDIVTRSRQIADLENSDYISDKELEFMLNEARDKVYADLINIGDRYYVKSTTSPILPDDFMSLSAVFMNRQPVPPKPNTVINGLNQGWYYSLEKDQIKFSENMNGPVLIEYYPIPEPIVWPVDEDAEEVIDEIDLPNNICFNYFCYTMAMKMKMKQGADFTQIQAIAQEQLETYIQLQHRDQFGVSRINNVYSSNWYGM